MESLQRRRDERRGQFLFLEGQDEQDPSVPSCGGNIPCTHGPLGRYSDSPETLLPPAARARAA